MCKNQKVNNKHKNDNKNHLSCFLSKLSLVFCPHLLVHSCFFSPPRWNYFLCAKVFKYGYGKNLFYVMDLFPTVLRHSCLTILLNMVLQSGTIFLSCYGLNVVAYEQHLILKSFFNLIWEISCIRNMRSNKDLSPMP